MASGFITNQEKFDFKQIVLQHLKKILELSSVEFHGGYAKIIPTNPPKEEYVPDNRKGYIQAVESLARVLSPHYDKEMRKDYDEIEKQKEDLIIELKGEKLGLVYTFDKKNRKVYDRSLLEIAHNLFSKLNLLLKRVDYLNKTIYSEEE